MPAHPSRDDEILAELKAIRKLLEGKRIDIDVSSVDFTAANTARAISQHLYELGFKPSGSSPFRSSPPGLHFHNARQAAVKAQEGLMKAYRDAKDALDRMNAELGRPDGE